MTVQVKILEDIRTIKKRINDSVERAFGTWESKGFAEFYKPQDKFPELPQNLSDLPNTELVNLLVTTRSWASFVGEQMLVTKVIRDARQAQHKAIRAKVIYEIKDSAPADSKKRMSTDERKTICEANEDVIDSDCRAREAEHVYDMLQFRYELLSKIHGTVSRAISIREAEIAGKLMGAEGGRDPRTKSLEE